MDVRSAEDRASALRHGATVHRDPPPTAGVAPVSPAPGLPSRRPTATTTTLADIPEADTRPRNRRRD